MASRSLTIKECPVYDWLPGEWMAIGGDAVGTYATAKNTSTYPFQGSIAMSRVWNKALAEADVKALHDVLHHRELSFTTGAGGRVAVCVPFDAKIPEGIRAFVVNSLDGSYANIVEVAKAGDVLPYGTPVIIIGDKKSTFTLTEASPEETPVQGLDEVDNLLVGSFTRKTVLTGQGYTMTSAGSSLYRVTSDVTIPAFSCYLPSDAKRTLYSLREMENVGIRGVETSASSVQTPWGGIFDLSGRRLPSAPSRGLYIRDGKKRVRP